MARPFGFSSGARCLWSCGRTVLRNHYQTSAAADWIRAGTVGLDLAYSLTTDCLCVAAVGGNPASAFSSADSFSDSGGDASSAVHRNSQRLGHDHLYRDTRPAKREEEVNSNLHIAGVK